MTAPADRAALIKTASDLTEPSLAAGLCLSEKQMERAIVAIEAAGCVVVPVEPNDKMVWAGRTDNTEFGPKYAEASYRACIAASPYRKRDGG